MDQHVAEVAAGRKWLPVGLASVTHGFAHVTAQGVNALYPVLREEFGFGYTGIAFLSIVSQVVQGPMQVTFGVITRFFRRTHILGVGTAVTFLGMVALAVSQAYAHLIGARLVQGLGTTPNHPVGGALMVHAFPRGRAKALAAHLTGGNIGGWLAPLVVGALLYVMGWREVALVISAPLLVLSVAFFFAGEPAVRGGGHGGHHGGGRLGLHEYRAVLRDRNAMLLGLVMMVGAAGRGTGALNTFLAVIVVDHYGVSPAFAAMFLAVYTFGGVVGPLTLGWLADRTSPRLAIRLDLVFSAVFGLLIVAPGSAGPLLMLITFMAGFFIYARTSLIQALLISVAPPESGVDTQLSMFHTLSAMTGPVWVLVTGTLVDSFGILTALSAMAGSYMVGMVILGFVGHRGYAPW